MIRVGDEGRYRAYALVGMLHRVTLLGGSPLAGARPEKRDYNPMSANGDVFPRNRLELARPRGLNCARRFSPKSGAVFGRKRAIMEPQFRAISPTID
jgi:hypothetical protein